jgi:hypothetical protein
LQPTNASKITTRRKFKCKACSHKFNVTSCTIFASCEVDFVDLLAAIWLIVNASEAAGMLRAAGMAAMVGKTRLRF